MYFLTTLVSFCLVNCGESLGIIFNTLIVNSTGFAFNVTTALILIPMAMTGEHFPHIILNFASEMRIQGLSSLDMPKFLEGVNYISPLKYAAASLSIKTFTNFNFTCTDTQKLPDGNCPIQTGQQALSLLKLNTSLAPNIGALVAVTVVYRVVAWVVLRLFKADFGVVRRGPGVELEKIEVID